MKLKAFCVALGTIATATSAAPSGAAFQVEQTVISPRFAGHDCAGIAAAISKFFPAKTEFESTAAFQARVAEASTITLGAGLSMGDVLAFRVSPASISMEYDADAAEATFSVLDDRTGLGFAPSTSTHLPMIVVSERVIQRRRYPAVNAFGVKTTVSETRALGCGVATPNEEPNRVAWFHRLQVKIPPETARALKGNVGAFLIGKPASPYIGTFSKRLNPRIDFPFESSVEGPVIVLDLSVVYFNTKTGEILGRTKTVP